MPLLNIDSRPDPTGRFSRVIFDSAACTFTAIRLLRRTAAGEEEVYAVPLQAGPHPAFRIDFRRYGLRTPPGTAQENPVASYHAEGAEDHDARPSGDGGWIIDYRTLPVHPPVAGTPRPTLRATLTLRPSADGGWVEMDLRFAYPGTVPERDPEYAWEPLVTLPSLPLDKDLLGPYRVLDAAGRLHYAALVKPAEPVVATMPVQFTALYREGRDPSPAGAVENLAGVILMGTDEDGHFKVLQYHRPADRPALLETSLRAPMHLDATRAHVHPREWSLSGGDPQGWGGARMKWRLRAFRLEAPVPGQPMDWHDVAALYRDWASTRKQTLYRKHPTGRTRQGPLDTMSPFTIITHYSFQGDAAPGPDPQEAAWLEQHPVVLGPTVREGPDIPGNRNIPLIPMLETVRTSVVLKDGAPSPAMADTLLEAQIWGVEPDGYFRYLAGWPPRTNIIKNDDGRFRTAMDRLMALRIVPQMTTDPLKPNFNRDRFRGHLRRNAAGEWKPLLTAPFHPAITSRLKDQVTTVDPTRPGWNRVWHLVKSHPEYGRLFAQRRVVENGTIPHTTGAQSAFHGIEQYAVCPTPALRHLYLTRWIKRPADAADAAAELADAGEPAMPLDPEPHPGGVLDHGVRLVEFMKHHPVEFQCFHPGHNHLPGVAAGPYAGVIGYGPWFSRRMEDIFKGVHFRGVQAYPSFHLATEFFIPEVLVPFVDEIYEHAGSSASVMHGDTRSRQLRGNTPAGTVLNGLAVLHFVYSPLLGTRNNVIDDDTLSHPGYREVRKANTDGSPREMLSVALDGTGPDAAGWIALAEAYFTRAFNRAATQPGLSPVGYPTAGGGTYTYHRAVQDVANLHTRVFRYGASGVRGERILLPASWYLPPYDYNVDALAMGIRAAQMQMRFAAFFRTGRMLGLSQIVTGSQAVHAWRFFDRVFDDMPELVTDCSNGTGLKDRTSRRTDVTVHNQAALEAAGQVRRVVTDQVQHMVWERPMPDGRTETLYLFANVGNTPINNFAFRFSRGVPKGVTLRGRTIRFDGSDPKGRVDGTPYNVVQGELRRFTLPERTFAAVHITPQ